MHIGKFSEFYVDVTKDATKIPQEQYLTIGRYPIIDQGQKSIAGMWDNPDGLYKQVPAIVFGDHTRAIKYADKPFFIGADGVKVLRPAHAGDNVKYLFYALQAARIPNLGYSRHFKVVKELEIRVYPREKQDEIVRVLEQIDSLLEQRQNEILQMDELVKSRFVEMFESQAWERVRAGTILLNMRNGVSPSNIGTYPAKVLTLSAITQGDFNPGSWKDGMFDVEPPIEKRVTASDFYMCRGNGNKKLVGVGVYSKEDRYDLIFPDTAIAATVDLQRICLPYLFYAWQQPFVRKQIEAGARTTNGTYKINQGVVSKIELVLPPIELQHQFAAFVAEVDKSKLAVQQSLEKLETLKKSLMQRYFG